MTKQSNLPNFKAALIKFNEKEESFYNAILEAETAEGQREALKVINKAEDWLRIQFYRDTRHKNIWENCKDLSLKQLRELCE